MAQIIVDLGTTFQTVDGFGTTERVHDDPHITDLFDPATGRSPVIIPQSARDEIFDTLYLDLGLTRLRYATDEGLEDPNDNADPNVVNPAGFNFAWKRLDAHADVVREARKRGVTTWWGSPIKREAWMTSTNEVAEYVEYAMQILLRWRDLGQELPLWSLANEPSGLGNRSPEFHRQAIIALGTAIDAAGLTTKIVLADDDKPSNTLAVASVVLADATARSYVAAVATHLYPNGGPQTLPEYTDLDALSALAATHNLPLWMTEWSNQTALRWAITMHELFTLFNVTAIDYMWGFLGQWDFAQLLVIEHTGTTYTGFSPKPVFGAFGQWSRYVKPGMQRVAATGPGALKVSAFTGPGRLVVVAVNDGATTEVDVGCPDCGTLVEVTRSSETEITVAVPLTSPIPLPANSITTMVYDLAVTGPTLTPDADVTDGGWLNEVGTNANLAASLADPSASTWVQSSLTAGSDLMRVSLSDIGGVPQAGPVSLTIRHGAIAP